MVDQRRNGRRQRDRDRLSALTIRFLGTRGYIEESSPLHRMHSALLLTCGRKRLLLGIAITHAHPDQSFALEEGTDVPVYVSEDSRRLLAHYPVRRFRVRCAGATLAYNPDIVAIRRERSVLAGIDVHIADGASLTRPLVRRLDGALFGHTTVRAQLDELAGTHLRARVAYDGMRARFPIKPE